MPADKLEVVASLAVMNAELAYELAAAALVFATLAAAKAPFA